MTDYKLVPVEPTLEMIDAGRSQSSFPLGVYKAMIGAAPAVQGEPVGEVRFELGAPSSIFAELYSKSLPVLAPGTKLYAAPQPAEQQPDVTQLVEALEQCITSMLDSGYRVNAVVIRAARTALAAHRKGGGK